MIRRAWRATVDHVGGFGLFFLLFVLAFAIYLAWANHSYVTAAICLAVWYVQARMYRERDKRRSSAVEIINTLEDDGAITTAQASALRRAARGD